MTEIQQRNKIRVALGALHPQLVINCKKLCGTGYSQWGEDLLTHTLSQFLSMKTAKQFKIIFLDGKAEHYITFGMRVQLKSSTSTFYTIYRKPMLKTRELLPDYKYPNYNSDKDSDDTLEIKDCFTYHLNNTLNFYDKHLITEHYYKGISVSDMSLKLDIPPGTLGKDIKKILIKLKRLCSQK